ncbi:MAG: DUF1611 domain-containing protein [Phycisphaerae bacterium]|nr:DUF1611 domain-containing protein [Phycisphaerae bacterium]
MTSKPEGNAIIYCQKAFTTTNGKTAHGLVRRTSRYRVLSVVDSRQAGRDAGEILDGRSNDIRIHANVQTAVKASRTQGSPATHLVVGLAPDGGRLSPSVREDLIEAIRMGLNVDSGLHDYLSEDEEISRLAAAYRVHIRDIRKPKHTSELHFFNGKIDEVKSLKVAVLGTDSAVGKRTTAWLIVDGLSEAGYRAELVGTGQTAWMQGARYGIILDTLVNDFLTGEIEHAVWIAWQEQAPDVIVIEGQGGLLNPAYPGGYEILAAARPDVIVLQHAPARKHYDGFPQYPLHPLKQQLEAIKVISGKPVVAITVNHEGLSPLDVANACEDIRKETALPAYDVLLSGSAGLCQILSSCLEDRLREANDTTTAAIGPAVRG